MFRFRATSRIIFLSSRAATYRNIPGTIDPDEISFVPAEERGVGSSSGRSASEKQFIDVPVIDTFSRARVLNFLKRYASADATAASNEGPPFEIVEIRSSTGATHFHAKLKLPLPTTNETFYGEGVAATAKEAEMLSSMHAEYIIDTLGFHIYTLPSMQRRHADSARKAGRWAPLPSDGVRDMQSLALPLPLRRVVDLDETEGGRWQILDTRTSFFISPTHTLLSPAIVDPNSIHRVRRFFQDHKRVLEMSLSFVEIAAPNDPDGSNFQQQTFVAKIIIPSTLLKTTEHHTAEGKAGDRQMALTLAAMHAELLIDYFGVALFVTDPVMQKEHAMAAASFGRCAAEETVENPTRAAGAPPLPLKQLSIPEGKKRISPRGFEEELVWRHAVIAQHATQFNDVTTVDNTALAAVKHYLSEKAPLGLLPHRLQPFFVEKVGAIYKASVALPLPSFFGLRGGLGMAGTAAEAESLAAMHALDVLHALGIRIHDDVQQQAAFEDHRRAASLSLPTPTSDPSVFSPPALRKTTSELSPHKVSLKPVVKIRRDREEKSKDSNGDAAAVISKDSGADSKTPDEELSLQVAEARRHVSKWAWTLEADSADGYIMISPSQSLNSSVSFGHTLMSPRQLDKFAKDRIVTFLASVGKRWEDVTTITKVTDDPTVPHIRVVIRLPVPTRFGDRIALGEAPDLKEAETVAAIHAELVLDTLGVCLYRDEAQQRMHADSAAKMGRLAPLATSAPKPSDTASPPPIRKEHPESTRWFIHVKKHPELAKEHVADSSSDEALEFILDEDVDQNSKARVQNYTRRVAKRAIEAEFRIETKNYVNYHVATIVLPTPQKFGIRLAKGIASTKRDAESLAFMHAERIIDALGIQIFNLPGLQKRHVERVTKLGRWAPLPDEVKHVPRSMPSPSPLYLSDTGPKPLHPLLPKNVDNLVEWNAYVAACEQYLDASKKRDRNMDIAKERVPRTGDMLYDLALDAAEKHPIDPNAKQLLALYCGRCNLVYPTFWMSRNVGSMMMRKCMTTVELPGFEHIKACGVGATKELSQRRAAMHALALLRRLDPDFAASEAALEKELAAVASEPGKDMASAIQVIQKSSKNQQRLEKIAGNWDRRLESFTLDGKMRVIELYTVCCNLPAPQVTHRQRTEGGFTSHSTAVEVTDQNGVKWVGRADDAGKKSNEPAAYEDLFTKLSANVPTFKTMMDLVKEHSHLNADHVVNLTIPQSLEEAVQRITSTVDDFDAVKDLESLVELDQDMKDAQVKPSLSTDLRLLPEKKFSDEEIDYRSDVLFKRLAAKLSSPVYQEKFATRRSTLSIFAHKENILSAIGQNPVTVLCGTTGCGKTTQVPQYIFDYETENGRGGDCTILVTQPRRLSAMSIAQRIADERLEGIGDSCGYAIRLDSRPGRHINLCTTGVVLRMLHERPTLDGVKFLIIDEIHERDINSDFLLVLVRELIEKRKDLRVVLMSATLQSEIFSLFFGGAPVINVEGYVHPVREVFLDDLLPIAKARNINSPLFKDIAGQIARLEEEEVQWGKFNVDEVQKEKYGFKEAPGDLDFQAIQLAIEYATENVDTVSSSILVFLPGWEEIVRCKEIIERNQKYHIIPLHSSVSPEEQLSCFKPAPEGKIKIILSTNIAESGVTIDDISAVIDIGQAKEKSFVLRRGRTTVSRNMMGAMSQLMTVFASRANCIQRRGRVGRTRPGMCVRLYSRKHFDTVHEFQTPEMLRQPLDNLCLQILALGLGDPLQFLQKALEPPSIDSIDGAISRLRELGAVSKEGKLTTLGRRLSLLPVSPRVGKMIIMGAIMRCLDSCLVIAAASDHDVFLSGREHRSAVRLHREDLSMSTMSDYISSVNAYNTWVTATHKKTAEETAKLMAQHMISLGSLATVSRYKKQFFETLCVNNFLPRGFADSAQTSEGTFVDTSPFSEFSTNVPLVKSVVASGFFPHVAIYREKKLLRSKLDNSVAPVGSSVVSLAQEDEIGNPFFVYDEMVRTSENSHKASLRGLSNVPLWGIILFGTNMNIAYRDDLNICIVDDWIIFRCPFGVQETIRKLRYAFHKSLSKKYSDPHNEENNMILSEIAEVVRSLLSTPIRPNDVADHDWEEKGTIVPADTTPVAAPLLTAEPGESSEARKDPAVAEKMDPLAREESISAEDLNITAMGLL
jgi:HrpA-like RNA helicase